MATKDTTNNSDSIHLSKADVERIQIIVEQIAPLAGLAEEMAVNGLEHSGRGEAAMFCAATQELVCKIGWLADMAAEKLGACVYKGSEGWLLPPTYHGIEEKQEEKEVQS